MTQPMDDTPAAFDDWMRGDRHADPLADLAPQPEPPSTAPAPLPGGSAAGGHEMFSPENWFRGRWEHLTEYGTAGDL